MVWCSLRLCLRMLLFRVRVTHYLPWYGVPWDCVSECYCLGYELPIISRGTVYLETLSQNVIVLGYELPIFSRCTVYHETLSQNVIVKGTGYTLSLVVRCSMRLCLRMLLFRVRFTHYLPWYGVPWDCVSECYCLGYVLPIVSRGTVYHETVYQNVIV